MKTFHLIFLGLSLGFISKSHAAFDPLEYHPASPPEFKGVLAPNTELTKTHLLGANLLQGPEGLAIDQGGFIYTGTREGNIYRIDPNKDSGSGGIIKIGNTGGRPLGIVVHPNGRLIIADMTRGLLAMDMQGNVEILTDSADGRRFGMLDDVDVARDGKVYFSEATFKYGLENFQLDVLENRPNGRLLVYDPQTHLTTTLMKELYFGNGVALSKNEDFVLVAESSRYRISRYWLKGKNRGKSDIFSNNLPGFPDNLSRSDDGHFWVAIASPRDTLIDFLHGYPTLKKLIAKLPKSVWAKQKKYGLVLKVNENGNIEKSFHDAKATVVYGITAVEQFGKTLFFGTYEGSGVGRLNLQ